MTAKVVPIGEQDLAQLQKNKKWLEDSIRLQRESIRSCEDMIIDAKEALRMVENRIKLLSK